MIPYYNKKSKLTMKKTLFGYIAATSLLIVGLLYPFSVNMTRALPNAVDPLLYAWNLNHNVQSALHGFKDLLDTNIFYPEGNTLALSDTLFTQSLLTSPVILLTKNPVLAENLYVLATFPLAALCMFLLAYYLTGSTPASMLAGIFYAFSYPRLAQIGHLPAISSQWLPLVFLYLMKWIRDQRFRDLIWLFVWYLASITSTLYFGVFLIPLSLIVAGTQLIGTRARRVGKLFKQFLIILIPAAIIVVVALFPYIRLRAEYPGIRRPLEDAARLSAGVKDYLTVLPTSWLGDIGLATDTNEHPLYPTITLTLLALAAIFLVPKSHRGAVVGFLLVAASAFALSLGPGMGNTHLPYYYLYKLYPLLQSIRVPARFSIFVILGFSVCAAFTVRALLQHAKQHAVALLIFLLFITEIWQVRTSYVSVPLWNDIPAVYHAIEAKPDDSIIVELPLIPEWNGTQMSDQLTLTYNEVSENDVYSLEAYRTYFSTFTRKRMLNGYSGYFPNVYHDHSIVLRNFPSTESITMLENDRVRYILVHSSQYRDESFADIEMKIQLVPELRLIGQFGTDYLYELNPAVTN